jgi:hypothetical protein
MILLSHAQPPELPRGYTSNVPVSPTGTHLAAPPDFLQPALKSYPKGLDPRARHGQIDRVCMYFAADEEEGDGQNGWKDMYCR